MTTETTKTPTGNAMRYIVFAVLVAGAFFGAYRFAAARNSQPLAQTPTTLSQPGDAAALGEAAVPAEGDAPGTVAAGDPTAANGGAAPACACCGSSAPTAGGVTGDPVEGAAKVEGDVQTLAVDLSNGYYEPNVIKLAAGVPSEITFGQSAGCTGQVMSKDLNFFEDLTTGPKTVSVPALEPGEYAFSCGMEMVFGKIVVE